MSNSLVNKRLYINEATESRNKNIYNISYLPNKKKDFLTFILFRP